MNRRTILLLILLLSTAACEREHRRPAEIYFPDGYVGWVRIEYGVPGAPALQRDFFGPMEYQRFPPSGLLQTSSELYDGAASVRYYYYSNHDEKPLPYEMVNGGIISWCVKKPDGSRLERVCNRLRWFKGRIREAQTRAGAISQRRLRLCH